MSLLYIAHFLDILDNFNLLLQKPTFIENVQQLLFSVSADMREFIKPLKHKTFARISDMKGWCPENLTLMSTSFQSHLVILEWMYFKVVGFMLKELVFFCILPI